MYDEFVGLYRVPQTDAGTITTVTIQNVFFRLNLLLNMFRRQGQRTGLGDASNSLKLKCGKYAVTDLESRAVSSHFDVHVLNLTASGMLKQCAV